MPDPTEFVITAAFGTAFGVFVLASIARKFMGKKQATAFEPACALPDISSPSEAPVIEENSRSLRWGRVSTAIYQPFDLLVLGFIFTLFFALAIGGLRASGKSDHPLDINALVQNIVLQFIITGIVIGFVISRVRPIEWLGLKWRGWLSVFLIAPGTVIGMVLFFIVLGMSGFNKWIESFDVDKVQKTVKLLQTSEDPALLGLMVVAAVIVAPICEEIVFRGYFYSAAKKFAGPWAAGICSALVFGAAHGSFAALIPLALFGCVLVVVYEKNGSIWAPIAVHCCFNGATVLIQLIGRYFHLPLDGVS